MIYCHPLLVDFNYKLLLNKIFIFNIIFFNIYNLDLISCSTEGLLSLNTLTFQGKLLISHKNKAKDLFRLVLMGILPWD